MAGSVYGQITVVSRVEGGPRTRWSCRCSCGTELIVWGHNLRSGRTRSCGCLRTPPVERFAKKIALTDAGCIEWIGTQNGSGYGTFYFGESGRGYAHRWSYEYHVGPIPEGLQLDHLCRNPPCVNPEHLEPVTPRENYLRGESLWAKNARKTHCPAGHPYGGDNLYTHPVTGQRFCRACGRLRKAAKYRPARSRKAA